MHHHTKILLKFVQMSLRCHDFFLILQMAIGRHLEFVKLTNFIR